MPEDERDELEESEDEKVARYRRRELRKLGLSQAQARQFEDRSDVVTRFRHLIVELGCPVALAVEIEA